MRVRRIRLVFESAVLRLSGSSATRDFAALAGKSGIADTFADGLEPLHRCALARTFMWFSRPVCVLVPWAPGR